MGLAQRGAKPRTACRLDAEDLELGCEVAAFSFFGFWAPVILPFIPKCICFFQVYSAALGDFVTSSVSRLCLVRRPVS